MTEKIAKGTWVEISNIVLKAGERAPQVPVDTQHVPLELRARGFLTGPTVAGQQVEIETVAGRRLAGILVKVNPAYTHGFGPPVPQLTGIGNEVRAILRERGDYK